MNRCALLLVAWLALSATADAGVDPLRYTICDGNNCRPVMLGSCVSFGYFAPENELLFACAAHQVEENMQVRLWGSWHAVTRVHVLNRQNTDVAVLRVRIAQRFDRGSIRLSRLSRQMPRPNAELRYVSYQRRDGWFGRTYSVTYGNIFFSEPPVQGDSGGAVYDANGCFVGVISGFTPEREGVASSSLQIYDILDANGICQSEADPNDFVEGDDCSGNVISGDGNVVNIGTGTAGSAEQLLTEPARLPADRRLPSVDRPTDPIYSQGPDASTLPSDPIRSRGPGGGEQLPADPSYGRGDAGQLPADPIRSRGPDASQLPAYRPDDYRDACRDACREDFIDIRRQLEELRNVDRLTLQQFEAIRNDVVDIRGDIASIHDNVASLEVQLGDLQIELRNMVDADPADLTAILAEIEAIRNEIASMREAELLVRIRQGERIVTDEVGIFDPDDALNIDVRSLTIENGIHEHEH